MSHQQKPPIESISEAEWTALPAHGQAVVIGLVEENRQLRLTISKLEEQLRRNSQNSSQPPSQHKAAQKPMQEETPRPRRRRGGQPGHRGRGRALVSVEAVDQLVVHRPVQCQTCGTLLLGYDSTPRRHQITEL